jgi:ribosomal protein S27AE
MGVRPADVTSRNSRDKDARRSVYAPLDLSDHTAPAADPFAPALINVRVLFGVACPRCGNETALATPGTYPHAARADCVSCGRFIRWLSKAMTETLKRRAA